MITNIIAIVTLSTALVTNTTHTRLWYGDTARYTTQRVVEVTEAEFDWNGKRLKATVSEREVSLESFMEEFQWKRVGGGLAVTIPWLTNTIVPLPYLAQTNGFCIVTNFLTETNICVTNTWDGWNTNYFPLGAKRRGRN